MNQKLPGKVESTDTKRTSANTLKMQMNAAPRSENIQAKRSKTRTRIRMSTNNKVRKTILPLCFRKKILDFF